MRLRTFTLAGAWMLFHCLCLFTNGQVNTNPASGEPAKPNQGSDDTLAILEVGASTNWNLSGGAATFAPNLAAECTPIENWLELEAGVSAFYTRNSEEWDTDFLFKKPWDLSKRAEFMLGAGPQWAHVRKAEKTTTLLLRNSPATSCSGRAGNIVSDGIWNQPTTTASRADIPSRSGCRRVYSLVFVDRP